MKQNKIKNIAVIAIFLLALAIPLLTLSFTGSEHSSEENRYLAPLPNVFLDDGSLNPNVGNEFKAWLEDHIGLRSAMVKFSSFLKLNVFNQSPSTRVHIGKDGWYYYTLDHNLEIATGNYPLSDKLLKNILDNHLATRDKLAAKGIDYVIVLPCSKVSIYPEYVGKGSGKVEITPVDIVASYLEENSDLKVIRLKEALLAEKENHQLYYKTDTHWNQVGSYVGYKEIIEKMKEFGLCSTDPISVEYTEIMYNGEFGPMLGNASLLGAEKSEAIKIINDLSLLNPSGDFLNGFSQLISEEGILTPYNYFQNSSVTDGSSVLIFGDSMFEGQTVKLLSQNFSELSYIFDYNIRESIVDYVNPDVVIYEMTERFWSTYPSKSQSFLLDPLDEFNAEILSAEIKGSDLHVTVKNTSSETWKSIDVIRCGIFTADDTDTGVRADIPSGTEIAPGESFTFVFSGVRTSLKKGMTVGMLQETVRYFDGRYPIFK